MTRPRSDVSGATGLVGALSLLVILVGVIRLQVPGAFASILLLAGTALPMVLWTAVVEKAHLRPSSGLDFSLRRPLAQTLALTRVKLAGFAATLAPIGAGYFALNHYSAAQYDFYFLLLGLAGPLVVVLGVPYVFVLNRYMVEPRDGLWHLGKLVTLDLAAVDAEAVRDHLRGWAVKAFFLAFMLSIFPPLLTRVLARDYGALLDDPVAAVQALVPVLFVFDLCFGTIGYVLTSRLLDSHIRSANPYFAGWTAALVCYPPFSLTQDGGPLDYRGGASEWTFWLADHPVALLLWGTAILALTAVYVWATVIFGIRFSNLTHRGIITNGPYRYCRHPAYLSKNLFWWMIHLPFLSTAGPAEAAQNVLLLLVINGIYYARARTEEKHLMADPHYRAYSAWIARHGIVERLGRRSRLRTGGRLGRYG